MENEFDWYPMYNLVLNTVKEHKDLGSACARILGILKGFSDGREENTFVRMNQSRIHKITGVHPNHQSAATSALEDWNFIKVHRHPKSKAIRYYEVFNINIHLFLIAQYWYSSMIELGKMERLTSNKPLHGIFDRKTIAKFTQDAENPSELDLEKIKKRIQEFDATDDFVSTEKSSSDSHKFVGPKIIDINKDNFKNPKLSKSVLPDAQKKPTLKRRTKVPQKQSLRDQLKNVPLSKPTKNNPRRSVVDNYHNTRNFHLVKQCWNGQSNLKKISDLKEKQNKTLDNSVLAVKYLLSGSLFEKGMTDVDGKKIFPTLPENFDPSKEKITVHWLLEKIKNFHDIITDQYAAPANKTPLTQMSLFDFIMGKLVKQERYTSVLFQYCCGEKKTVQVDNYPKMTKLMIEYFGLVTGKEKTLSAKEQQAFAQTGLKLLEYREEYFRKNKIKVKWTEDIKTKDNINTGDMDDLVEGFYKPLKLQWGGKIRDMQPSYFTSDHAWQIYMDNVKF